MKRIVEIDDDDARVAIDPPVGAAERHVRGARQDAVRIERQRTLQEVVVGSPSSNVATPGLFFCRPGCR